MSENSTLVHGRDSAVYDGIADESLEPGQSVQVDGFDGEYPELVSGHDGVFRVVKEYSHTGMSLDDEYESGDHMEYYAPLPGDRVHVLLDDAEDIGYGDVLEVNANGYFQNLDTGEAVVESRTEINNTSGNPVRIVVEVI